MMRASTIQSLVVVELKAIFGDFLPPTQKARETELQVETYGTKTSRRKT
jgi:hypothetical protein